MVADCLFSVQWLPNVLISTKSSPRQLKQLTNLFYHENIFKNVEFHSKSQNGAYN